MAKIAGPDALAAGIDGLLLHDLIAGFTGLDLPAAQMPPGQPFSDRAGLIESAWQSEDSSLEQPFPLRQPALPWRLLFNSTDVGSGCRAIIADRLLPAPPGGQDTTGLTCDLRSAVPGGGSFDFFAKLPCMQNIATVTAAMLSARFPYITPSGVVTSCENKNAIAGQFVDGGYVDSSGLITLADLLPSLTAALRVHNAAALAQAAPGQPVTLVVPVVVYLGNSPRPVPVASSPSLIQEPFVPLDAKSAAATQLLVSDTLLQRIQHAGNRPVAALRSRPGRMRRGHISGREDHSRSGHLRLTTHRASRSPRRWAGYSPPPPGTPSTRRSARQKIHASAAHNPPRRRRACPA